MEEKEQAECHILNGHDMKCDESGSGLESKYGGHALVAAWQGRAVL